jgi:hypothetical protein
MGLFSFMFTVNKLIEASVSFFSAFAGRTY